MTNHDALARRIAEDIMTACRGGSEERAIRLDLIGLYGRRLGAWAIDALARRIVEHLREALPTSEEACEWTQQGDEDCDDWATDCGKDFRLDGGWPSSNGMKYCCFCGKKLIDVPFDELEADEL